MARTVMSTGALWIDRGEAGWISVDPDNDMSYPTLRALQDAVGRLTWVTEGPLVTEEDIREIEDGEDP